jgi:hypothetical protein
LYSADSGLGQLADFCEHSNVNWDSVIDGHFDQVTYYQLLKKGLCSIEFVSSVKVITKCEMHLSDSGKGPMESFHKEGDYKVSFQVLTAASMKMAVLWVVAP